MHNHHVQLKDEVYATFNMGLEPGMRPFPRPISDMVAYFRGWLDEDGEPWWPFW